MLRLTQVRGPSGAVTFQEALHTLRLITSQRIGGSELTELILRERPGIRVLQMPGELAESFVGRNLTTAFLQKPFTSTVLIEKIREVMAAPAGTRWPIG
jgi:hypothetical protein